MDLGWIEFSVIIGCGLIGFLVVNAFLEYRRVNNETARQERAETGSKRTEEDLGSEDRPTAGPASERSWWEILGVNKEATQDDIKTAFRREIARYHPDRVEGLGGELRELAEKKAKEINWAYAVAKRERRFS
ncbi:J domain-containing protein [Bradyrhizobium cenepequi]